MVENVKKTDLKIIVPSSNTARIQECHFLGHIIFSAVEKKLIS